MELSRSGKNQTPTVLGEVQPSPLPKDSLIDSHLQDEGGRHARKTVRGMGADPGSVSSVGSQIRSWHQRGREQGQCCRLACPLDTHTCTQSNLLPTETLPRHNQTKRHKPCMSWGQNPGADSGEDCAPDSELHPSYRYTHLGEHAHTQARTHARTLGSKNTRAHTRRGARTHTHTWWSTYTHTHTHLGEHARTHTTHSQGKKHVHTPGVACVHMLAHTHTQGSKHTHIHGRGAHTHVHTHTHPWGSAHTYPGQKAHTYTWGGTYLHTCVNTHTRGAHAHKYIYHGQHTCVHTHLGSTCLHMCTHAHKVGAHTHTQSSKNMHTHTYAHTHMGGRA